MNAQDNLKRIFEAKFCITPYTYIPWYLRTIGNALVVFHSFSKVYECYICSHYQCYAVNMVTRNLKLDLCPTDYRLDGLNDMIMTHYILAVNSHD